MYKVLIVEDEHLIRKWLTYTVDYQSLGLVIIGEAENGKIGEEMIRQLKPDIVLTDINMPVYDAFTMFENTKDIPYQKIILSGYNDFLNAKKSLAIWGS
jgi:two-component system response regulator YesN